MILVLAHDKELSIAYSEQSKLRRIVGELNEVTWVPFDPDALRPWPNVSYLRVFGAVELKVGVIEWISSPE
jgi:hypothetical protein